MTAMPVLAAAGGSVGDQPIEVLRFDRHHPRVGLGPHRHQDLELMYFEAGAGANRLGDRTYDVGPGDVLLVAAGQVHDAALMGTARGWAVEFQPTAVLGPPGAINTARPGSLSRLWWANPLLAPFLLAEQQPVHARFTVPAGQRRLWSQYLTVMWDEHVHHRDGRREVVAAHLQILLVALSRLAADVTGGMHLRGETRLSEVFAYIEDNFDQRLSTADVARAVGASAGYLTTLVRQRTGRTIGDWITERRMAAARDLLVSTELSAEQIAGMVGYDDPGYFNRRFRQLHGTPPGAWRSSARARG